MTYTHTPHRRNKSESSTRPNDRQPTDQPVRTVTSVLFATYKTETQACSEYACFRPSLLWTDRVRMTENELAKLTTSPKTDVSLTEEPLFSLGRGLGRGESKGRTIWVSVSA